MSSTTAKPFRKLLAFLDQLEQEKLWYRLEHIRDSIMVAVSVPGERWEVEFFEDGAVEVERFLSTGRIEGEDALDVLMGMADGKWEASQGAESSSELQPTPLR